MQSSFCCGEELDQSEVEGEKLPLYHVMLSEAKHLKIKDRVKSDRIFEIQLTHKFCQPIEHRC